MQNFSYESEVDLNENKPAGGTQFRNNGLA